MHDSPHLGPPAGSEDLKIFGYPICMHLMLWLLFSVIYFIFRKDFVDIDTGDGLTDFTDCMYFSAITHTTVGYGERPS